MAMFRMVYATRFFRDPAADPAGFPGVHWTAVSATSCAPPADRRRAASQKQAQQAPESATNGHGGIAWNRCVFCVTSVTLPVSRGFLMIFRYVTGDFVLVTTVKDVYDLPGP